MSRRTEQLLRVLEIARGEILDLQEGMTPEFSEGGESEHSSFQSIKDIDSAIGEEKVMAQWEAEATAPELLVAAEAAQGVLVALCNWIAEDPNAQHYEDCDPDGSQGCTCPISSAPDARSRLGSAIAKARGGR